MFCKNKKCQAEIPDGALFCQYCGHRQEPKPRKRTRRPNGTGTVYYMGDGRKRPWRACRDGITIGYAPTKADAMRLLESMATKTITEKYNLSFSEVYEEWKAEHFRDISKKGIEGYTAAYTHLSPIHAKRFRDLRVKDFQSVIDQLTERGYSVSAMSKLKQLAGQMYKWAMREDIVATNYAPFIKLPEEVKKEKDIFTADEIERIKADDSDTAKIVLMMIYTGVRINEIFSAKKENYHSEYFISGSKTDAGRDRIIPIPPVVRPHFEYFASRCETLLLDGYEGNKTLRNFRARDYTELLARLEIPHKTPHSTRHTYTSMAVKNGVKPEMLQKILGHASYTTTADVYTHANAADLVNEALKIR